MALLSRRLVWRFTSSGSVAASLAVGIGASAAMVGIADVLFYRAPPHVADAERLVAVKTPNHRFSDLAALGRRSSALDLAAYRRFAARDGASAIGSAFTLECVSGGFFTVLGTPPLQGRFLTERDAEERSFAVIGEHVGRSHFGSAAEAVGNQLAIGNRTFTVVGVVPRGFGGIEVDRADVWLPLPGAMDICTPHGSLASASINFLGRLRPGASLAQALSDVEAFARESRGSLRGPGIESIHRARRLATSRDLRVARWTVGAAAFLFLVSCANAWGLLLLRGLAREAEYAVRRQLGASSQRLFLEAVFEALPAVVLSAVLGFAIAAIIGWHLEGLLMFPAGQAIFHPRTFIAVAALSAIGTLASGLFPALRVARSRDIVYLQRDIGARIGRRRMGHGLLVIQATATFVLIAGAGLMARTIASLSTAAGYDTERLVSVTVDLSSDGFRSEAEREEIFRLLLERTASVPGVELAALSSGGVLRSVRDSAFVGLRSTDALDTSAMLVVPEYQAVSTEYFDALQTRILQGRAFRLDDTSASEPVVIIDEQVAAALWPTGGAVGQCARLVNRADCVRVVGVTEMRRHADITVAYPQIFLPLTQARLFGLSYTVPRSMFVRLSAIESTTVETLRGAVRRPGDSFPVPSVQLVRDLISTQTRTWRLADRVFSIFGVAGAAFGALGLYASLSFAVRRQTREIGVRLALGAPRRRIITALGRGAILVVFAGVVIGIAILGFAGPVLQAMLFGVAALDIANLGLAAAALLAAGIAGALTPSIRATRVDPAAALRHH